MNHPQTQKKSRKKPLQKNGNKAGNHLLPLPQPPVVGSSFEIQFLMWHLSTGLNLHINPKVRQLIKNSNMENCDNSLNNLKEEGTCSFLINPPPKPLISWGIPCPDSNPFHRNIQWNHHGSHVDVSGWDKTGGKQTSGIEMLAPRTEQSTAINTFPKK